MSSLLCGLLHDDFQRVGFTPIPIEICDRLLSDAKDTNTFSLCVCVQRVSPSRQCNYALPSHPILFVFFQCPACVSDVLPYCDMKLTLFCVSTTAGLLHDVFQLVSVHPHPH